MYTNKIISMKDIEFYCKGLIAINLMFFLIQLIVFQVFGHYIDFDNFVREQEARSLYSSKALDGFILSIRATGLYSEPSFYSMSVFCPTLILMLIKKKIDKYIILGLLSCVISLSIASLIIVALSLLIVFFGIKKANTIKIFVVICTLALLPYASDFYTKRVTDNSDYDAVSSRLLILKEFQERDRLNDVIGSGFFWDESQPIGKLGLKGYNTRDSSFYPYIYFSGGVLGVFVLLYFMMRIGFRNKDIIYGVAIALLFKFNIMSSFFWLFVIFCKMVIDNRKAINKGK